MGNFCGSRICSDTASSPAFSGTTRRKKGAGLSSRVSSASLSMTVPLTPRRSEGEILQSPNIKSFAFTELRTATRNFRPDSMLDEGSFGSVFKGWVDEHTFAPDGQRGSGLRRSGLRRSVFMASPRVKPE